MSGGGLGAITPGVDDVLDLGFLRLRAAQESGTVATGAGAETSAAAVRAFSEPRKSPGIRPVLARATRRLPRAPGQLQEQADVRQPGAVSPDPS